MERHFQEELVQENKDIKAGEQDGSHESIRLHNAFSCESGNTTLFLNFCGGTERKFARLEQNMKNILITGGSGFIGRNLIEGLSQSYNVFSPRHEDLELLDYDALLSYITANRIDVIIHAAIHVPQFHGAEKELFNDMQMFLNLEKVSVLVEKVIYFGSGAEYDKRLDIIDVKEEDFGKSIPNSDYGIGKYIMTKLARNSSNIYNLRLFGVFGKYELWQVKYLSNICCKAVFDLPLTIRKNCRFNFLWIDDLIWIVDWFLNNNPIYHDYNVCHDKNYLLSELAEMVTQISGKKLIIQMLSDERNMDYTACNQRLHNEIKNLTITPIKESLEELYYYYELNKTLIDYNVLSKTK